jgi:hypothetical protein
LTVEDDGILYDSWDDFIKNKYKYRDCFWTGIPIFWTWFKHDEEYAEAFLEEGQTIDDDGGHYEQLILIYLSLAPTAVNVVRINVTPKDQENIKTWLKRHKFPMVIPSSQFIID